MADDYKVQNIHRYHRKTYKNGRRSSHQDDPTQDDPNNEGNRSPRSDDIRMDLPVPGCSCDLGPEAVASILHKKCPVITLAQQQLQRLLDESDKILCDNTRCCRSIYEFLCICKEILSTQHKCLCALLILVGIAFAVGLLFGAASCGTYLRRFNSPILTCLDNLFISDPGYEYKLQEFRGIV